MIAPTSTALTLLSSLSVALSSVEDPVRSSLQATADHFSNLVSWSTVTVALGVSLEGVEILHAIVAWRKRRRREKREDIELRELADNFPCGKAKSETKSQSDDPKWAKLLLRVGIILVVIGVVGEWRFGTKLEDAHNAIHRYDLEKLIEAERLAGVAATSAKIANEEAGKAHIAASDALTLSRGARQEADSFEDDIKTAKQQAADAESHLADALQRAAKAEAELKILRTPRSLSNTDELIAALKPFNGTEYTLNVFQDEEAIELTRAMDVVLGQAGWVRKQPKGLRIGITAINVFSQDNKDTVEVCLETGIQVHAQVKETVEALRLTQPSLLPKTVQAASALRTALVPSVSPSDERNVGNNVLINNVSAEGPVLICVGKKP